MTVRTAGYARAVARDDQQERLLGVLARREGEPVTYGELRDAGIEFPASLVSEVELAGVDIDRCYTVDRGGHPVAAVRLPAGAWEPFVEPAPVVVPTAPQALEERPAGAPRRQRRRLVPIGSDYRRRVSFLAPLAVLAGAAVTIAVVLSSGTATRSSAPAGAHAATPAAKPAARSRTSRVALTAPSWRKAVPARLLSAPHADHVQRKALAPVPVTPAPTQVASPQPATQSPSVSSAPAPGTSAPNPQSNAGAAQAVEGFYEAAAQHRYPTAWALADANMRNQLGGYAAFEGEMSSVRSIAFHGIEPVASGPGSATFAVRTTSVQTTTTQQCSGTVRAVQATGAWLVDGISISCS